LKYIIQLSDYINLVLIQFVIFVGGVCVFLGILNVVNRAVIHYALPWVSVLLRYLLIWLAFLGATILVKKDIWIRVDFIVSRLEYRKKILFDFLYYLILFVFSLLVLIKGIDLSFQSCIRNQIIATLNISQTWLYLSAPLAGLIMLIHLLALICQLVLNFRKKN
jgi:C4-dicarboxylate transporter, DctQ subunit